MPGDPDRMQRERLLLVERLTRAGMLRSESLIRAFAGVPREAFVPEASPAEVYIDSTVPVFNDEGDQITTSSQPGMMAFMLEQLDLKQGHRVLEIGAGTGYNAAILAEVTGPGGSVDSIEIDPTAAEMAAGALAGIGSQARVHHADGGNGWPEGGPYDRVIATVAVWDIPGAWIAQTVPGGVIVAPLSILGEEYSCKWIVDSGSLRGCCSAAPCAFVRFQGDMAHPNPHISLGDNGRGTGVIFGEEGRLPNRHTLDRWLDGPSRQERLWGVGDPDVFEGLVMWLLMKEGAERLVRVWGNAPGSPWQGPAVGLYSDTGMAFIASSGRWIVYGEGPDQQMWSRLDEWRLRGRPDRTAFRIDLIPGLQDAGPGRIPRREHTIIITGTN